MKKIIYLLGISFFLLQSCSSSSSDGNASSFQLVGKWEIYQVGSYPAGTIINSSSQLVNFQFACASLKDYVQFGSEGTAKVSSYNSNCSEQANIGTYTKTDFLINFYQNNDYSGSWEIISLNNTYLKVKYPNPPTGTPEEIIVVSFKKV